MSSKDQNLSAGSKEKLKSVEDFSFALIVSDWNEDITYALRDECIATLKAHGAKKENIIETKERNCQRNWGSRIETGKETREGNDR